MAARGSWRTMRLVELLVEFGPTLKMPHSRPLGDGLFELRPRGPKGIGRAVYCFLVGQRAAVLHTFVKRTRTTPRSDLAMARNSVKEVRDTQD